eukprot:Skav203719  [mRNA]  locus=scaffold259:598021:602025:- [translate_table: standard]
MPGDSAETLDDLRQECAVLRQRVGLEAENTELQALVKEWRMWYAKSYKPQIEFLDAEIARMVTMAPTCRRLASTAVQEPEPGTEQGVMPKMSTPPIVGGGSPKGVGLSRLPAEGEPSPDLCVIGFQETCRSSEGEEHMPCESTGHMPCLGRVFTMQRLGTRCQLTARRLLADGTEWEDWQKWAWHLDRDRDLGSRCSDLAHVAPGRQKRQGRRDPRET